MASASYISGETEVLISRIYDQNPDWVAKQVRDKVNRILKSKNDRPISLSSVQKKLARIRENRKKMKGKPPDVPWSMATLKEYPLPPEALPMVLKVRKKIMDFSKEPKYITLVKSVFSIRLAMWIGRFHILLKDQDLWDILIDCAYYSAWERASDITGQPFDSSRADEEMLARFLNPNAPRKISDIDDWDDSLPNWEEIMGKNEARRRKKRTDREGGTP